jgi:catechol 2,3-dioxygenase-like lactoylglutathione lyase family enzyme
MNVSSCYPVIAVDDVAEAAGFARSWLGFRTTFASDWYVSLVDDHGHELAFLRWNHETVPAGHRRPVAGLLVNLEVDDVDDQWERLVVRGGLPCVRDIRTEDFGQRHFILAAPGGYLVDVITNVPATGPYVTAYTDAAPDLGP